MAQRVEAEGASSFVWLLTGAAIGAVLGILYAPSSGVETRESLVDSARGFGDKSKGLMGRISDRIPARVKAAAGFGAVKEGGREALREAKHGLEDRMG